MNGGRSQPEHLPLFLEELALGGDDRRAPAWRLDDIAPDRTIRAAVIGAGLLVVGSHGHGGLHHLLVGSVTEAVLRQSTIPVVVVPGTLSDEDIDGMS